MPLSSDPAALASLSSLDDIASREAAASGDARPPRPTNVPRTVFHVASGALALVMMRVLPSREWLIAAAAGFAVSAWTCEITRRLSPRVNERLMRVFGPVAHAHEWQDVNSATWYATALFIMSLVVPLPAAELGVVVLAVADPMAGIVGRRFGRYRLASGRSLEGALGFAVTGALAALVWMTVAGAPPGPHLALALVAGIVGAAIELLVSRVDDNLAIPLFTSLAVAAAALVVG